jgi:integrase/recombinase XerD
MQDLAVMQQINDLANVRHVGITDRPEIINWILEFNSPQTRETYIHALKQFINHQEFSSLDDLYQSTHAHVIDFKNYLLETYDKPLSINTKLSAVSSLFEYLIHKGQIKINPAKGVKRLREEYDRVKSKCLSKSEARLIMDAPLDANRITDLQRLRDRAIMATLFYSGARRSEVCTLKVEDFFQEKGYFMLDLRIKGGRRNRKPVSPECANYMLAYLDMAGHKDIKGSPLFQPIYKYDSPRSNGIRHLKPRQLHDLWNKYTKQVGIDGTCLHSARTTHITEALENGCSIENAANSVGHKSIGTTKKYDQRTMKYKDSSGMHVIF